MSDELLPADTESTSWTESIRDAQPMDDPAETGGPTVVEVITPAATEALTCPECGTTATVTVNRRDAADFCRKCDFPMFWTPSRVHYDNISSNARDTLRRLPGTVGRATVASLPCPHCAEPNAVSAQVCVRCGLSMHPVEAPPPPQLVYVPPPPPEVYVEPERRIPWWVWALLGTGIVALVTLVILVATHTID